MNECINPQRPDVEYPEVTGSLNPDWIVGFVDGEGCFHVAINKNDGVKFGYQILPEFMVVQHGRDINVLYRLRTEMKCGVVRSNHGDRFCWRVRDLKNLVEIIVPFFEIHPLKTKKNIEFRRFAKVVKMMHSQEHLSVAGFREIERIASEMNRGRRTPVRIKIESTP
jgi:hypothetical protein